MNIQDLLNLLHLAKAYYTRYESRLYPVGAVLFFILGTICILFGLFFPKSKPVQAKASEPSSSTIRETREEPVAVILVDVAGAVKNPGVYAVDSNDRLLKAIEAAGGFDERVNKSFVAKSLNLSTQLTDQQKIYIPYHGEEVEQSSIQTSNAAPTTATTNSAPIGSRINLNTASQSELETLTGIGAVRAQKIISSRPFKSLQEVVQKGAMTQKILNDNKDIIIVE
jgi:competence protein ComEA